MIFCLPSFHDFELEAPQDRPTNGGKRMKPTIKGGFESAKKWPFCGKGLPFSCRLELANFGPFFKKILDPKKVYLKVAKLASSGDT